MLINQRKYQAGFGLVELLIGTIITLVILAAASTVMLSNLVSNRDNIRMARLNQELRQVVTMVSRDLKRATLWEAATDVTRVSLVVPLTLSAVSGSVTVSTGKDDDSGVDHIADIGAKAVGGTLVYHDGTNLYQGNITAFDSGTKTYSVSISTAWPASAITVDGIPALTWSILPPQSAITVSGDCILFAFDTNMSGTYTTTSPNEFFGYRHDTAEQSVEVKTASAGTCAGTSGWENLTDEKSIAITSFSITNNSPAGVVNSGLTVLVREYTISITGRLLSDASAQRTMQETIRVRNDRLSI